MVEFIKVETKKKENNRLLHKKIYSIYAHGYSGGVCMGIGIMLYSKGHPIIATILIIIGVLTFPTRYKGTNK
jgi:hypothetical protein